MGRFRNFFTFRLFSTIFPVFFFLGLARRLALLITGVALDLNLVLTLGLILPSLSTWKLSEDSALCRSPELGATSLFKLWSGRGGSLWRGVRAALKESLLVVYPGNGFEPGSPGFRTCKKEQVGLRRQDTHQYLCSWKTFTAGCGEQEEGDNCQCPDLDERIVVWLQFA